MGKLSVAALALLVAAGTASAQQRPDPFSEMRRENEQRQQQSRQREQRTQAATVTTKAEPMSQSLDHLLGDGWDIISNSLGGPGAQLVLRSPQIKRWALCYLQVYDGNEHLLDKPTSRCMALN